MPTFVRRALVAGSLVILTHGCVAAPKRAPQFTPPQVTCRIMSYTGSPLSGPSAALGPQFAALDSRAEREFDCEVWSHDLRSDDVGPDTRSVATPRIITSTRTSDPQQTVPDLTRGTRWEIHDFADGSFALPAEVGAASLLGRLSGRIAPGHTTVVLVTATDSAASASGPQLELLLHVPVDDGGPAARAAPEIEFGLAVTAAAMTPGATNSRELVVLDRRPLATSHRVRCTLPSPFTSGSATALTIVAQLRPAPAEATSEPSAATEFASARPPSGVPAAPTGAQLRLASVLNELRGVVEPRQAVYFLARATDAALSADYALIASRDALRQLRDTVLIESRPTDSAELIGLILERASLRALGAPARTTSSMARPPEYDGLLARHAGAVARVPSIIEELCRTAPTLAALRAGLIAENLIALEDNAPTMRVRAHDWLTTRGLAPADFDPLAPPRARRAALQSHHEKNPQPAPAAVSP